MRTILILVLAALGQAVPALAQDTLATVRLDVTGGGAPAADAAVRAPGASSTTDARGRALLRLLPGNRVIVIASPGFHPDTLRLVLRAGQDTTIAVALEAAAEELEAIVVSATRAARHIEDEPIRVEVLAGEDVGEKTQMRPQDLTNFVAEMSGVRIQQTAPGRGGAAIRIQGLAGQYTQVLNDGLPLGGARPDGLVLLQMPPLDLTQVEVIKGAATALYGPSALGGVMNLVSRRPDGQTEVLVSGRDRGAADAFLWHASPGGGRFGFTLLADAHVQQARDLDGDGWMNLPGYRRAGLRPRFFWTGENGSTLLATVGAMAENREGGTLPGRNAPDGFPFDNGVDTRRVDAGAIGSWPMPRGMRFGARIAGSALSHDRRFGTVRERDDYGTFLGEATVSFGGARLNGLAGLAAQVERYRNEDVPVHDYDYRVPAIFGQVVWTPVPALSLSGSGRCDVHNVYGTFCSPRLGILARLGEEWSLRLSGGTGFSAPTPFLEATEAVGLTPVRALQNVVAERAANASLDLTGKIWRVDVTATLFANRIAHQATTQVVPAAGGNDLRIINAAAPARTSGGELFLTYDVQPVLVTAFWSYLYGSEVDGNTGLRHESPLNPRHTAFIDITWEGRGGLWIALEALWVGRQALEDDPYRTRSREYTNVELLVSKTFGRVQVFANADNLTDVRQSDISPLLRPSRSRDLPWTVGQWGPVEGRLLSAGVRYKIRMP